MTSEKILQEPAWSENTPMYSDYWGGLIFKEYLRGLDPTLNGNAPESDITQDLKQGPVVSGFIEIYALVEETKRWEQNNTPIQHDDKLKALLREEFIQLRMQAIEDQWRKPAP